LLYKKGVAHIIFVKLKKQNFIKISIMKSIPIIFLVCLFVLSCQHKLPSNYADFTSTDVLTVADWWLIGPFSFDTLKQPTWETFHNKDLAKYGIDEKLFSIEDLQILADSGISIRHIEQPFGIHRLTYFSDTPLGNKSNYYLATIVNSPIEQDVYLMVDGAANYQIWLNKKEIVGEIRKAHQRRHCNKFAKIQLLKGENLLFAKVNRGNNFKAWGLDVFMAKQDTAYDIFKANYFEGFVVNPVFNDSIVFYTGPIIESAAWLNKGDSIISLDVNDNESGHRLVKGLSFLTDGFYKLKLKIGLDTLSQLVYKGHIEKYISFLKEQSEKTNLPSEFNAVMKRVQFLLSHYNYSGMSEFTYHSINLVFWVHQLDVLLNHPLRYAENLSINVYQTDSDPGPKYYAISKGTLKQGSTPLIVVLPYDLAENNFLEGWYLGNFQQLFIDCWLAAKNGFAIVFLYGGGKQHSETDITNEFHHVMADIGQRYPDIDTSKVFLTGHCSGAAKALLLTSRVPSKVAALGVKGPMLYRGMEPGDLAVAKDIPFYFENGIYDTRIPTHEVNGLVENLKLNGQSIEFISLLQSHSSYRKDENRTIFSFFRKIYTMENHQLLP
jgi:predicted esterase